MDRNCLVVMMVAKMREPKVLMVYEMKRAPGRGAWVHCVRVRSWGAGIELVALTRTKGRDAQGRRIYV